MAATFTWCQDTGAATGSPAKGTTRTEGVNNNNWKNADNPATAYTSAPITAGSNSYTVYQFGKFTGTFNKILDGKWAHTAGTFATGVELFGKVTSEYQTPSTDLDESLNDMTDPDDIEDGQAVLFHVDGPEGADPATEIAAAGYSQYLVTQLVTSESAVSGDTATITLTLRFSEN